MSLLASSMDSFSAMPRDTILSTIGLGCCVVDCDKTTLIIDVALEYEKAGLDEAWLIEKVFSCVWLTPGSSQTLFLIFVFRGTIKFVCDYEYISTHQLDGPSSTDCQILKH